MEKIPGAPRLIHVRFRAAPNQGTRFRLTDGRVSAKRSPVAPIVVNETLRAIKTEFAASSTGQLSIADEMDTANAVFDRAGTLLLERGSIRLIMRNTRTALEMSRHNFGAEAIAAGLLLGVEVSEVSERINAEVAQVVEGVDRLSPFYYHREMEEKPSSRDQLFRVILARIRETPDIRCHLLAAFSALSTLQVSADRIVVTDTIAMANEKLGKSRALAEQALSVHCEVLGRLGFGSAASQLFDLARLHLDYEKYRNFAEKLKAKTGRDQVATEYSLAATCRSISTDLGREGLQRRIIHRVKVVARAEEKFERARAKALAKKVAPATAEKTAWDELSDMQGFRVICQDEGSCYTIRDQVKTVLECDGWVFVEEASEISDFIEHPKPNGYRSIHLHFVRERVGQGWETLCAQVRTEDMELVAEWGTASHWVAYKAELAEMDKVDFDAKLRIVGRDEEETRQLRWENFVDFARHYVFVYMLQSKSRPPVDLPSPDSLPSGTNLTMKNIFVGTADLPRPLDIALAILPAQGKFYDVYYRDAAAGQWVGADDCAGVPNGALVFVDLSRKNPVAAGSLQRVSLPFSFASLRAQMIMDEVGRRRCSLREYPSRPDQITGCYGEFMQSMVGRLTAEGLDLFPLRIQGREIFAQTGTLANFELALRRSGFISPEVLGALWFMFPAKGNDAARKLIGDRYFSALWRGAISYIILPRPGGRTGSEIYLLPEDDRPGVVRYFYNYLVEAELGVEGIYSTTMQSRVIATQSRRAWMFETSAAARGEALGDLPKMFEKLPAAAEGQFLPRGPQLEIILRLPAGDAGIIDRVLGLFADEMLNITRISAPISMPQGQPAFISLDVRARDRGAMAGRVGRDRLSRMLEEFGLKVISISEKK